MLKWCNNDVRKHPRNDKEATPQMLQTCKALQESFFPGLAIASDLC